ncbi:uncharacterized protein PFL1_00267 [Pseudozyma flocculosa PF-1]|uniref:BZIP domain-containing protein n=1 Tax=Pseudozyma flocculosa TaxID=84751 RepID=A0A5C3ESE2_9BASI|nr:uncharacterized protein PFL1_00267 [Pseudozyma flocculosa PF-1]EPQ32069.1 hypothetical protein PFL1_00267 [Pseudozyma flocculosa PF-1]SPO35002.1 uncharacterized protein PSFLO_00473 [Pseudozyma flocculosa]
MQTVIAPQPLTSAAATPGPSKRLANGVALAPRPPASSKPAPALAPAPETGSTPAVTRPPPSSLIPTPTTPSNASSPPADGNPEKKSAGGSSIQPSKEWVLPARAKPGRKPSETEPPTKRKAQNRASQRAFRERKQMYLADLEAKVAAYEKAEIDRSVEIQKAAKRLKDENDALKRENAGLKEKVRQLETFAASVRAGAKLPAPLAASRNGPGCKAPAHEAKPKAAPRKGVLTVPGSSKNAPVASKGGVRFADEVAARTPISAPVSAQPSMPAPVVPARATTQAAPARSLPQDGLEKEAMPISLKRPIAPSTVPSAPLWSIQPPMIAEPPSRASATLSPPLMGQDHAIHIEGGCGFCTEASPCVCADDFLNLDSSEKDDSPKSVHIAKGPTGRTSASSDAVPLRQPRDATMEPVEKQNPNMRIDALTNAAASGSQLGRKRLWYTIPPSEEAPTVCPTSTPRNAAVPERAKPLQPKKRLWYTVPASAEQSFNSGVSSTSNRPADLQLSTAASEPFEPVCTGDPSSCGACSGDPGLAAFCEAVTNSVQGGQAAFTSWDAGNAVPLASRPRSGSGTTPQKVGALQRPALGRFSTTGHLAPSSSTDPRHLAPPTTPSSYAGVSPRHQTETIPSAWRQIRAHPRFNQWQGGLDLLAEVVSRRSGSIHSPLLGEREAQRAARAASVEIEPLRRTSTANVESHDRATKTTHGRTATGDGPVPKLLHTTSDMSVSQAASIKRERDDEMDLDSIAAGGHSSMATRESKRRRILVEREAVQEALALLDRGTAQFPVLTSALPTRSQRRDSAASESSARHHLHEDADEPCPCPWWRPAQVYPANFRMG